MLLAAELASVVSLGEPSPNCPICKGGNQWNEWEFGLIEVP